MGGKDIEKWADEFMFEAESISVSDGPKVYLLSANNDPLGSVAAAAKAYKGEFVQSLAEVTDEERRYYLAEIQKTALAMPLESVNFQFRITGVTRGFTHQLVRQRTAAYSQESTRFAVKSGVPVGLPPSIIKTKPIAERAADLSVKYPMWSADDCLELTERDASGADLWRDKWDEAVEKITEVYNFLVNDGMPAEDARGLLPTNLLTQVNFHVNFRGLKDHAGNRLCTQAQYEWKVVWAEIIRAMRAYGETQTYHEGDESKSSAWQFRALSDTFRPACFYAGKCVFGAEFDRKCNIRKKVTTYADNGVPSSEWESGRADLGIPSIQPQEWLADGAAR